MSFIILHNNYYIRINADYVIYNNNNNVTTKKEVNSYNYFDVSTTEITKIGYYYKPYHALYKLGNDKTETFYNGKYSTPGTIYEINAEDLDDGFWEVR